MQAGRLATVGTEWLKKEHPETGGEHPEKPRQPPAYHRAAVVEVMLIFVSMSAEVHARRHSRERPPLLQAQPAVYRYVLVGNLAEGGEGSGYLKSPTHRHPALVSACRRAGTLQRGRAGGQYLVLVGLRGQPLVKRSNLGGQVLKAFPEQLFLR